MAQGSETKKIVLIEGDGIGPEIAQAVVFVLEKAGAKLEWIPVTVGDKAIRERQTPLPAEVVELIKTTGVALKGPLATPIGEGHRSINVLLRKELDLYANFRPIKSVPGVKTRYENVDLVFVRENTEGLYSGLEQEVVPGVVTSLKVATRKACIRIAEFAFSYAEKAGRKKVTAVHKANILKMSDGLSLICYREIANRYPTIVYDEVIVDAAAMHLVLHPERFDVLLMENLYGDILSDLGAGLIGGLGLAPSGNFGPNVAIFEAVHGTAPDIAGKGVANPTALLLSAVQMLRHFNDHARASAIENALFKTFEEKRSLTPDLGGSASTMEFAKAVISKL